MQNIYSDSLFGHSIEPQVPLTQGVEHQHGRKPEYGDENLEDSRRIRDDFGAAFGHLAQWSDHATQNELEPTEKHAHKY